MKHKGWLTADGSVVREPSSSTIGEVLLDEKRYNLSRVYVSRIWLVRLNDGRRVTGFLSRRDAIDAALRLHSLGVTS